MGVSFSFLGLVSGNSLSPSTPDCEVGQGRAFEPVMVSGNRSALPPTRPLRTVLARFPAHGSSKSLI